MLNLPLILFVLYYIDLSMERRVMHYNSFGDCKEYPNLPISSTYFKVHNYAKNNRTAEKTFHITKEISGKLDIIGTLLKCDVSGNPDTCETIIKDYRVSNICKKMNEKGQAWTPFMESIKPPLGCPMKPGDYWTESIINEGHTLRFFPVPVGLWKARAIMRNEEENLFCFDIEIKILDVRRT